MCESENRYQAFCCSPVQGFSHRAHGLRCEDAALRVNASSWCLAVVSDGHGSTEHCRSQYGAWFVVHAVEQVIRQMMEGLEEAGILAALAKQDEGVETAREELERNIEHAKRAILLSWNQAVEADLRAWTPGNTEEYKAPPEKAWKRFLAGKHCERMYGATVEAVVAGRGFWFALQLGDGVVALRTHSGWSLPLPNDDLPGECTYSLCGGRAVQNMVTYVGYDEPLALIVATDGIAKAYATDDDLFCLYDQVVGLCATRNVDSAMAYVQPRLYRISELGSGDDLAFAGIILTHE